MSRGWRVDRPGCTCATSAQDDRSWSSTAVRISGTTTCCPRSTCSPTRAASFTTTSAGEGGRTPAMRRSDVTMAGEVDDLDCVRRSLGLETMAVLGHSWGCLVAMEYALRFPERVSHLILLGAAPASGEAARTLGRSMRAARTADESATMAGLEADAAYQAGDLEADAAWYRIHFKPALQRPELLDDLVARLRRGSSAEGIVVARVIEQRLYDETWRARRLRPAGAAPAVARPDPAAPRRRRLHPGRAGASGGRRDPRLPPGAARRLRPLPIP